MDLFRVGHFSVGGRFVADLDLVAAGAFDRERDTFHVTPPQRQTRMTAIDRRYAGQNPTSEVHDNGSVGWTAHVSATTADQAIANARALLGTALESATVGRFIEWKPSTASQPVYFPIRAPGRWVPDYSTIVFEQNSLWKFQVEIPVAPLAQGAPMDINEDWKVDSLTAGDYTAPNGTAGLAVDTANRVLAATTTSIRTLAHTGRGYGYIDVQVTQKINLGAALGTWTHRVAGQHDGVGNQYLYAQINSAGALAIGRVIGGASVNYDSDTATAPAVNSTGWLRYRREGNVVTAEWFVTEPTPTATPAATVSFTLSLADQATFAAPGWAATRIQAGDATTWTYGALDVAPYTYTSRNMPEDVPLLGVPGDAPALMDLFVTQEAGAAAASIAALIGWHQAPPAWSLVWNGDFEDDVDGWRATAVAGLTAAATSITRQTSVAGNAAAKYGLASAEVVTPATTATGAAFPLYRRFKRGQTYTVQMWVWSAAGVTTLQAGLGVSGDNAVTALTALTATPVLHTTTWTPTADRDFAYVFVKQGAGTATTYRIDGVRVYEGTVAPTLDSQAEGRGGQPPVGLIEAESCDTGDLTTWTIETGLATNVARGTARLTMAATNVAGSADAGWWIDPGLLVADDFRRGEIDVEVWARVATVGAFTTPKLTLSARPAAGLTYGAERFTEWGSAGRILPDVAAGADPNFRLRRLGTLTLIVDRDRPARWKLHLAASWAAATAGQIKVDHLSLLPIRASALSPSARPNDANYPPFIASVNETTKVIRSDLSAFVFRPPHESQQFPDHGLSGAQLEMPPGDGLLSVHLASTVPDDPTQPAPADSPSVVATVHAAVIPRYYLARGA